jgi:hypothetical protein
MAEPQVSESASVVYVVEALTGNVRQHDALTGTRNWEFDCSDVSGVASCQDSVEAEFSISKSGNIVYYGDIFGKIVALEVAAFATASPIASVMESSSPTAATSNSPTVATASPTVAATPTPTIAPSIEPTIALVATPEPSLDSPSITPSVRSNIFVIAPVVDSSTPPVSASSISSANQQVDGGSSGDDKNSFIMISVIAVVAALVIGFVGLFAMQRRRRRNKGTDRSLSFNADRVAEETEVEVSVEMHAAFLKHNEELVVAEVETEKPRSPSRASKPKQKKSPTRIPALPTTPSTLASIVEAESEEDHERMSDVGTSGTDTVKAVPISPDTVKVVPISSPSPMTTLDEMVDTISPDVRIDEKSSTMDTLLDAISPEFRLDEESSAMDSILDAISPDTRLEEESSTLDAILDAISPDEPVEVGCDDEYDKTSDQSDDGDDPPDDEKVSPKFVPTSLASVFDRAVVSPLLPPLPLSDNGNDDVSDATDDSGPSDNSNSSNDDRSHSNDSRDDDDDDDADEDDLFEDGSYLPTLDYMFGGSVPQPHDVDEEKKTDDDAKSSHDDWSIDSSSVYIDEGSKKGSVIGDRAATPQPPEDDNSVWKTIERALGLAPDSPPRPSWHPIDENGSFDDCPDDELKVRSGTLT